MTTRRRRRGPCVLAALMVLLAPPVSAQSQSRGGLPAYAPLNPVISSRSSLAFQPYTPYSGRWSVGFAVDYGSAAELDVAAAAGYVLDAEIFRPAVNVTRELSPSYFLLLRAGVLSAHAGVADAFFDAFHRAIGYDQWSRSQRPRNEFGYAIELPGLPRVERSPASLAFDDVLIGVGRRFGAHHQSLLTLSLPVSTAPEGYRRGAPSATVAHGVMAPLSARLTYEGSLGAGYTPRHGVLHDVQRTAFVALASGVRVRVWREHALYGSLFYHSAVYRGTLLPELERGERTIDFGIIVRSGGRDWRIGLVEETRATDGGIDLTVKLSATASAVTRPRRP